MSGTTIGGVKAAIKILAKDPDHFRKIALKSQEAWENNGRKPRGFAANPDLARAASAKGLQTRWRGPAEAVQQFQDAA